MPQATQDTVQVKTRSGKVVTILKSDLQTAVSRGATPVDSVSRGTSGNVGTPTKTQVEQHPLAAAFNEGATGSTDLKALGKRLEDLRQGIGMDPVGTVVDIIKDMGQGQADAVNKYGWKDPKKYVASIPVVGPGLARAGEESGMTGIMRILGMAAGAGIGSKVGEVPGRVAGAAEDLAATGGKTVREVAGAGEKDIQAAKSKVDAANAEKTAKFTEDAAQAKAKARGEYEANEIKQKTEADKVKKEYAESKAAEDKARIEQSRAEGARRSYSDLRERYAKETAENLDKAEKMEKLSLDARYEDFRKKVLGVSPQNPNGTLQSSMEPVVNAVIKAKANLLKGSATNITLFNDMMGRMKEFYETATGEVKPLNGGAIPTDQLRGYISELNDKLYETNLPGDVRDALKSVRGVAEESVDKSIAQAAGKSGTKAYNELKADYTDYMETWRDTNSGSPLPKIRQLLRQPMAAKRGIPVYREVADILDGKTGEKAIPVIARKKAFGADPALAAKMRQASEKLDSLPKPKEVSGVKRPEIPKPSTETAFSAPKPSSIEKFDRRAAVEEGVGRRGKQIERYSIIVPAFEALHSILRGNAPSPELLASPAVGIAIRNLLSNPKVLDWLSKGGPPA